MEIIKVISLLLDYPEQQLVDARAELDDAIEQCLFISPQQRQALHDLLQHITGQELLDAQSVYLSLFNRGRHLSLLMFEHVHGESRDRGQAMVDLLAEYEQAGFAIAAKELPDYIPLYLEYLATCDQLTARTGLADIQHLLAMLGARLEESESPYAACFHALLQLAGVDPVEQIGLAREKVAEDPVDDSLEALDAEWEEEAVTFMQGDGQASCGLSSPVGNHRAREEVAVPIHWVDFTDASNAAGKL